MGITSLVGSILVLLAGLGAIVLLALISVLPHTTLNASEYFASIVLFIMVLFAVWYGYQEYKKYQKGPETFIEAQ